MKKVFINLSVVCSILTGCTESTLNFSVPENAEIVASENKNSHMFPLSGNFDISEANIAAIDKILRNAHGKGEENAGFIIISDEALPAAKAKELSERIASRMRKAGFIDSRIVDSGVCVYKGARKGVRIDILRYDVQRPDTGIWDEPDGDCEIERSLPKKGMSGIWNLEEMVANKADLVAPRKYKGQKAESAVAAMGNLGSSSSGGGSSSGSSSRSSGGGSSSLGSVLSSI